MRILFVTLIAFVVVLSANAGPNGTRTIFFADVNRDQATLEADAGLIADSVQKAKSGDFVEALTLDGRTIFSCNLGKKLNALEAKREKNVSLNSLRQFYLSQINSPRRTETVDIAAAMKRGIGRFNAEAETRERYILVFLTSGLQKDRAVDFGQGYPSDSFVNHQASPFSRIPRNQTGKKLEVLFVSQPQDYSSSFQAQHIERFYSLLLHSRNAELTGFSEDHQTISELVRNGSKIQRQIPKPENDGGKLILYKVDSEKQSHAEEESAEDVEEVDQQASMINTRPVYSDLSGSVLSLGIENGTASLWVSIRDPQGNPVTDLQTGDFQIYESHKGKRQLIPPEKITLNSKQPLSLVLLRDVSPSMNETGLKDSEDAIKTFLDLMAQQDTVSLVNFSGKASVAKKFTTDKEDVKKAMRVPWIRFGTSLYDGLIFALEQLEKQEGEYLKAVIGFTDGQDTGSEHSSSEVYDAATEAGIPLFLIGAGSVDTTILSSLAKSTGGLYFSVFDTGGLQKIYERLSGVLNNSVLLSYPTSADSGKVEVELLVSNNPVASGKTKVRN